MKRLQLWPRSLSGQIALLVALALFVAQAINFGLLLRERRIVRFTQVTLPAITRIVDAVDRIENGRFTGLGWQRRGRVRLVAANPVPGQLRAARDVERGLAEALDEAGIAHGRIVTGVRPFDRGDPRIATLAPRRIERLRRFGAELLVAVELPGRGWLSLAIAWPRSDLALMWRLVAQTVILYVVVLIPILWAGRRISEPLRSLAASARGFRPGAPAVRIDERGPGELRDVISAYNAMGDRVTAMLDEKDRMLGAIGHDLRTPLAALRVRVESVEDEQDRVRMADIIAEMSRTLEDILSLARLGRPSEAITDVDLAALVDAVVADFHDLGADVVTEDAPRTPMRLRPSLMRRALRNLIENAVKYGGSAEVRLTAIATEARIEVCDRGPGIPAGQLDAVFDPFMRLENSRNRDTGGIGLGLALARAIVGDAGGVIRLANRDGGGLIATVVLPR